MPILTHPIGVENKNETSFATGERALLDTLYLRGEYQIDNPNGLDWDKIFDMLPIYHNQRMASRVRKFYKQVSRSKEG